jgi:hypothetical protein
MAVPVAVCVDALLPAPTSQRATPPWCEHVPERWREKLYVPSRHLAVAPGGADAAAAAAANAPARRTTRKNRLAMPSF